MTGCGGDETLPPADNGGEFLLSLLKNHHHQQHRPPRPPPPPVLPHDIPPHLLQPPPPPLQPPPQLSFDPAVAAVGPAIHYVSSWASNGVHDHPQSYLHQWQQPVSAPVQHSLFGFHQNPFLPTPFPGSQFTGNPIQFGSHVVYRDELQKLGFQGVQSGGMVKFGSFSDDINTLDMLSKGHTKANDKFTANGFGSVQEFDQLSDSRFTIDAGRAVRGHLSHDNREQEGGRGVWGKHSVSGNYRSIPPPETMQPPPGFSNQSKGRANWDSGSRRKGFDHHVNQGKYNSGKQSDRNAKFAHERERVRILSSSRSNVQGNRRMRIKEQFDHRIPPSESELHSVSSSGIEESKSNSRRGPAKGVEETELDNVQIMNSSNDVIDGGEIDGLGEQLVGCLLLEDEWEEKDNSKQHKSSRDKDFRSDSRGKHMLSQRMRSYRRYTFCRGDIDRFNAPLLTLYESLIPAEEEKEKQKQLLTLLENLVNKEWPKAQLYLYGSCANSFGVSNSDIDVCLEIEETVMEKSDVLLKLADILQSDNLQNVQALTRARVPIVKLMDPSTGISCDICINNVLAVVNTKLLRDYAQVDSRLRQLAFIVKYWAKSRGVNETYQGTLSSYAYVLMCIHFLQQRKPAILPCLQGMETTYAVTVDDVHCAYFDQVDRLRDFGMHNKETIAQLVFFFFNYWAYYHDYTNDVISVRRGCTISKLEKDWTRRIGNDRHLICIEDPFEISHDLGRVVDKHSIRVLREEFERAAEILQYDPNPCSKLFEPYIPS